MAICAEGAPLGPEDRVELLAVLASDSDSNIAERAQSALLSRPTEHFLAACARPDADPRLFAYCADNLPDKKGIADALARNGNCPTANVVRIASHLTSAGIQALLDNLERFISDPQLVLAVSASAATNTEQRALLEEMQKGALAIHEIEEAAAAEIEPDPIKRQTLFQRVAHMNVVQRLTLALKGGRSERMLLIPRSEQAGTTLCAPISALNRDGGRVIFSYDQLERRDSANDFDDSGIHQELHDHEKSRKQSEDAAGRHSASVPSPHGNRPTQADGQQEYFRYVAVVRPEASPEAQNGRLMERTFSRITW